jgi:hypothetical protein
MSLPLVSPESPSRELVRTLRTGVRESVDGCMPESVAWQTYLELKKRGEPDAPRLFIGALRSLHSRRSFAGADLPSEDPLPEEHKLVEDEYLADLWKAYKKCIRTHRTGPAQALLRDIEEQLSCK